MTRSSLEVKLVDKLEEKNSEKKLLPLKNSPDSDKDADNKKDENGEIDGLIITQEIDYGLPAKMISGMVYESKPFTYETAAETYTPQPKDADVNETEVLTASEATETFNDVQYSSVVGNMTEVNNDDKRKLDWMAKTDPALFNLIYSLNSLTCNVNYTPF